MREDAWTVCLSALVVLQSQLCLAEVVSTPRPLMVAASSSKALSSKAPSSKSSGSKVVWRMWTDASGSRQAKATLLKVDGQTLLLRKSNGKLARINLEQLSEADQRFVAENRPGDRATEDGSAGDQPLLGRMLSALNVPNLAPLAARLGSPDAAGDADLAAEPETLPADLVYVRISREFLNDYIARPHQQETPITDCILGTNLVGRARTHSVSQLVLKNSPNQAAGDVLFSGTVHSQTLGYNGPVILHSTSRTQFQARKPLTFGSAGLQISPARSAARTQTTTNFIETLLPGLRGRIAERIAWRRVGESRAQSDAIAARHAEARIDQALNARVDRYVAQFKQVLATPFPNLAYEGDRRQPYVRYGSTPDYLFVTMQRTEATPEQRQIAPPLIPGNPGIVAQVHRTVVKRVMADGKFQTAITPLLSSLFGKRVAAVKLPGGQGGLPIPAYQVNWSGDGQWLTFSVNRDSGLSPGSAVAAQDNYRLKSSGVPAAK